MRAERAQLVGRLRRGVTECSKIIRNFQRREACLSFEKDERLRLARSPRAVAGFYGAAVAGVAPDIGAVEYTDSLPEIPTSTSLPTPEPSQESTPVATSNATATPSAIAISVTGTSSNKVVVVATTLAPVARVKLYADGDKVGVDDYTTPYSFNWDASAYTGKTVRLKAVVSYGNNATLSETVSFTP